MENTIVSGVVVYGLAAKPTYLHVPWSEFPIVVGDDYSDPVFYEADLDRLQATDLLLDLCSDTDNYVSWTFEEEEEDRQ